MIKFVGRVVLWVIGAVLGTASVILLYEAYLLTESGTPLPSLRLEELLWGVLDFREYLQYAAAAGAVLAVISMVPSAIRQNAERLLLWSIFGAISGAISLMSAMFVYQAYRLASSGVAADQVPFLELVTGVMKLQQYAPYGAVAGALLALLSVTVSILRALNVRSTGPAGYQLQLDDPDSVIRSRRAQRAREYLAARDKLDPDLGRL